MPPRKRRQSNQGDENANDRQTGVSTTSTASQDAERPVNRGIQKGAEGTSGPPERRLTARQQSKQDALLESAAAAAASSVTASAESGKKTTTRHASEPTRFSTRIVKRPRRDLSPTESPAKKAKKAAVPEPTTTPETKAKRHWELWSCEDKDSFFEGLCEHGKDFDSIHNLIVSKCKRRGGSQPITVKNKEQVRHFYYRTWHKISKLIEPVEDLKKDIQELYGLISFGVLRKKMRGGINPNDKNWQKLNELVHFGATTIKIKGKKLRIKVPVCPALKKLNNIEEPKRDPGPKIPEKIRIEFRPKTNGAWSHVQEQAQNPRLRMTVRPDRCLSSLVKFLEQKWRPHRLKLKENLNEEHEDEMLFKEFRVYPHSSSTVQCVNMEAVDDPVLQFCLKSHRDAIQTSPSVNKTKKAKPKSSTPVPEPSEPKESVINDFKTFANKLSATDTNCADSGCKPDAEKEQAINTGTSKDQNSADTNKTSAIRELLPSDSGKSEQCKEAVVPETDKSSSSKEVADKELALKETCAENSYVLSNKVEISASNNKPGKELVNCEEGCVEVKETCSSAEQDITNGCDHNVVKDSSQSCSSKDQGSNTSGSSVCKDTDKSASSNDSVKSDDCKDLVSSSSDVRDSKSWQNTCSVKPTCSKCSSNESVTTPPPCDNVKSSETSESVGPTMLLGVTVKQSESTTALIRTRTYSIPDLSAIVDGENAMFPDSPLEAYCEKTEISNTITNHKEQRTNAPNTEIDFGVGDQGSPPKIGFSSPSNEDCLTRDSVESSHSELERICRDVMERGWNIAEAENVKLAELYLMFGKNGELRFEYDWCNMQISELQEKLLSLNNILRRLANLATVEFTDFSKTPASGSPCQMCGTVLGGKQGKGKEKALVKSPPGKPRANKSCRDMSTQTNESSVLHKKEPVNLGTVTASPDGVFRVPVASPVMNQKSMTTLTDRELVHHLNPGVNKQIMRPRKLKSVSRKPVIQRTILPKAQVPGQMVTFYPVVANAPGPPGAGKPVSGVGQTIVGHPMGIQTQSGTNVPEVNQTIVGHPLGIQTQTVPISMVPTAASSQQLQATTVHYVGSVGSPTVSSTTISSVELSLSPGDGDQTLMRIPESQIGSMSQEALKAAGLSTVPLSNNTSTPSASKPSQKGSISPPNLSSLLDISFSSIPAGGDGDKFMDLSITDNSFTGLLEESKPLSVDPGLTTPPIRNPSESQLSPLHSPPVRSLFKMNSPTPDQQWLNGEVPDLSLTSFLESPSKPALSTNYTQTTSSTYNTQPLTLFGDSSRDSQSNRIDVDSTLQCMMNESSIDYVRKFADLAEQIAQDAAPSQTKPDILNNHTVKELT